MEITSQVYTLVISSCYSLEDIPKARELFDNMLMEGVPLSLHCLTAMMSCYAQNLQLDEAYTLMRTYALGPERIIEPDNAIFTTLIHGCMKKKNYQLAWDTFDMMRQFYLEADTIAFTLMIDICAQTYEAERAFNLYEEIKFLGLPYIDYTFNAMLKVCARRFDYFPKAFEIFDQMKVHGFTPDAHTYHLLLSSCGPVGNLKAADLILDHMEKSKVPITIKSYGILLNIISRSMSKVTDNIIKKVLIERADLIFTQLQKYALQRKESGVPLVIEDDTITVPVLNSYISVYTEAMYIRQAEALFPLFNEFNLEPDLCTYNIYLKLFSNTRRVEQCFDLYRQMKQKDITLDKFSWTHLLNVCAKTKYYANGLKILRVMVSKGM